MRTLEHAGGKVRWIDRATGETGEWSDNYARVIIEAHELPHYVPPARRAPDPHQDVPGIKRLHPRASIL